MVFIKNKIFRCFFWIVYGFIVVSLLFIFYLLGDILKLKNMNPFYVVVLFVFAKIVAVFIHELMHMIFYRIKGIKIRVFAVKGVVVFFRENHYKVSFKPEMILKGNMVTPMLGEKVDCDEKYYYFKSAFIHSLIAGPVGSLMFIPVFVILIICGNLFLKIFSLWIIVFFVIQFVSSLFIGKNDIGDIRTAKICQSDKNMLEMILREYELIRATNDQEEKEYIAKKLKENIFRDMEKNKQLETNSALVVYLNHEVVNALVNRTTVSDETEEYLTYFIEKYTKCAYVDIDEDGIILLLHILYYYKYHGMPAWQILENVLSNNLMDFLATEIKDYYLKQKGFICYGEGDIDYLLNEKNIKCNSNWKLSLLIGGGANTRERIITQLFIKPIK